MKDRDEKYQTNIFKDGKNYSINLLIKEGKIKILITKDLSDEIIEFSNSYSLKQLQITNKYFSTFSTLEQICSDLDKLMKLKVNLEEEQINKVIILKIPTSIDKSSGEIVFKILKFKKVRKVNKIEEELKNKNILNDKNATMLLGNINELTARIKKLEKREEEKDKKINELKEEITGYQEKINNTINKTGINVLADENNIAQVMQKKNEDDDDEHVDMNLETERSVKFEKKKVEIINTNINNKKSKEKENNSSDEENDKKNESDEDNNIKLKSKPKILKEAPNFETTLSGFPIVKRDENLKDYINSRIFFTIYEMQMVKMKITKGKKNVHAYFDLLYRATLDGDTEDKIIKCCEGSYPQLILFLTTEGARFGVYIDKEKTTSFFKKEVIYKEKPGTSFLISLNKCKAYSIKPGEIATNNRPEKLCFGRTYYYNSNESNWMIYIPRNDFLGVDCKFGDKESTFGEIKPNDIVGFNDTYHLKDVEIFQVMLEKDDNDINDKDDDIDNSKNVAINTKKVDKIEKIENDNDTVISEKKKDDDEDEKDDNIINEKKKSKEKKDKKKKKKYEINTGNEDDDSDNL